MNAYLGPIRRGAHPPQVSGSVGRAPSLMRVYLLAASAMTACLFVSACDDQSPERDIMSENVENDIISEDVQGNVQRIPTTVNRECTLMLRGLSLFQAAAQSTKPPICRVARRQSGSLNQSGEPMIEEVITYPLGTDAVQVQGPIDAAQPERWAVTWMRSQGTTYEVIEKEGDCFILNPERTSTLCFGKEWSEEAVKAASATPSPIAPAAAAGAGTANAVSAELIRLWYIEDEACRGSTTPEDPTTLIACQKRSELDRHLDAAGYCYGREGESGNQYEWQVCGPGSNRPTRQSADSTTTTLP